MRVYVNVCVRKYIRLTHSFPREIIYLRACTLSTPMRNFQIRVSWPDGNFWTIIKTSAQTTPYHGLTIRAITERMKHVFLAAYNCEEKQALEYACKI